MLNLTDTNDKLQVITSAAVTVDVVSAYADLNTSTGAVTPGKQLTAISTATTTDIVAAPGSSVVRNVKTLHIRNKHASLSTDVTVQFNDNATLYEMHKATLRAGETLEYIEGVGFFTITNPSNPVLRVSKLGSDQSNSTTTPTELTGMSLTTGTGTFYFVYAILYQSSVTTTGVKFSVNHTGTVTFFVANRQIVGAATLASDAAADQDVVTTAGGLISVMAARAKGTAGWGTSISVDTANSDMLEIIEGLMNVSADGDIELWHGSETANQTTVKAGTSLILIRTGD